MIFSIQYATIELSMMLSMMLYNLFSADYHYIAPVYLPGVSATTPNGFEANTMWHIIASFYAAASHTFFDGLNVVLVMHVLLLTQLLRHEYRTISGIGPHSNDYELLQQFKAVVEQQIRLRK